MNKIPRQLPVVTFLCLAAIFLGLFSGCSTAYNGEKIFFRVGCSQCHSFQGKGGRMGPDLSAVSNIRSDDWINSYLQDPKKMNPRSRMPAFGHLSKSERNAIISFLKK